MMPKDLQDAQIRIYVPCGLSLQHFIPEAESQEYSACSFTLNGHRIQFRSSKITPTKIGQFVTFWKRFGSGPIMPVDAADTFDFLIVNVRTINQFGQFIFPKEVLLTQGYISKNGIGGKRAMRVYPSWDKPDSKQAIKTQTWQLQYFIVADTTQPLESQKLQNLLGSCYRTISG